MNADSPLRGEVMTYGEVWRGVGANDARSPGIARHIPPYISTSPPRRDFVRGEPLDAEAIKCGIDLLDLVGRDSVLRKVASTRGGEYAGPCPFCGGEDRFRVQPAQRLWFCRVCADGHWQDVITYVMRRDKVGFREACERLTGGVASAPTGNRPRLPAAPSRSAPPSTSPRWRQAGAAVVQRAETALWSAAGSKARAYLDSRGLSEATVRAWRLGYISGLNDPASEWGLNPESVNQGRVRLPAGVLIPWFVDGEVTQLKLRQRTGREPKYLNVAGGHPLLFGAHTLTGKHLAIATEGEFDAMLAYQAAPDHVGVFTLGGCTKGLDSRASRYLLALERVLVVYDNDVEGQRGAQKLAATSPRMRIAHVPDGAKDITEYGQRGGDVVRWLAALAQGYAFPGEPAGPLAESPV